MAKKIQNHHFKIAGGTPGMEISWQVTGIHQDAYTKAHPVPVEEKKLDKEKGLYLHPKAFGQPPEKGVMRLKPD